MCVQVASVPRASLHEQWVFARVFADGLKSLRDQVFVFLWNVWNARNTSDTCVAMSFCLVTLSRVNSRLRATHILCQGLGME